MNRLGEIITSIAVTAFVLALCTMDSSPVLSIASILLSGTWIVVYSWCYEERRRKSE